ncbi:MAG: 30S ribosomal protein S4 [Candidatus Komeilibacteria bacterium]|nr:30S ribosomal protein S4 [Candidatus Komeilibacteria bacterium]
MGRNLDPKCKQERREGMKLFLKGEKSMSPKNPLIKRPYPPGMHGPAGMKGKRMSGYGTRLREKQRAKKIYRLMEKDFHKYYVLAGKAQGDTSENLLRFLELRLDNVIYRLGLADSRDSARQLVNHGQFLVNNKRVTIPSYQVKSGDLITLKKSVVAKPYWVARSEKLAKVETPGWLALNAAAVEGKVISLPSKQELVAPFDPTLIIEFYSR